MNIETYKARLELKKKLYHRLEHIWIPMQKIPLTERIKKEIWNIVGDELNLTRERAYKKGKIKGRNDEVVKLIKSIMKN